MKLIYFLLLIMTFGLKSFSAQESFISPYTYTYTNVGVEYIHSPPPGVRVSSYLALPQANEGHIEDFNSYNFNKIYPDHFTISDGTLLSPFVEVDMADESKLRKLIKYHSKKILNMSLNASFQIFYLKDYVSKNILNPVPDDDPVVQFFKKENYSLPEFQQVGTKSPGHFPVSTNFSFQTVKLEDVIQYGRGYCIHKVLVTSLIMKELNIPHVIRYGSTGLDGHDWIELPDGRILDPTWNLLEKPQSSDLGEKWFKLGWTSIYKYDFYPFAVWN